MRVLMYQPRTPAAQTSTMVIVLKRMVCMVDTRRGGVGLGGESMKGVAGDKWVPSTEGWRISRKEAVESLLWSCCDGPCCADEEEGMLRCCSE